MGIGRESKPENIAYYIWKTEKDTHDFLETKGLKALI